MFILTAKLTRRKLIGAVIAGGLLLCAFIIFAANRSFDAGSTTSAPQSGKLYSNEDRLGFISSLGWEVSSEPENEKEVVVPEKFDDVYNQYNEIQLSQGYDLKNYSGKRVMQYTYRVLNYNSGNSRVYLILLIYNNKVIGGDVHSAVLNGFMQGLKKNG